LNITLQFLGIIGAAIVGPFVLAGVLAGVMVWLSKQVSGAPEPPPAAARRAVAPQPQAQPEPHPQPEIESFVTDEAAGLERDETHKRLVPSWLVLVYAVVIVWALVYVLMEVVPFFKPLTPQNAPAPAASVPTATVAPAAQPAAPAGTGNAANGAKLFEANGCQACHSFKDGEKIIGPSLYHAGSVGANRIKGADYRGKAKTAEDYIRESILDPNLYVVPGFPSGVMVQDFAKKVSSQDIDDLVAFVLTK
jgi:cytochrome c2